MLKIKLALGLLFFMFANNAFAECRNDDIVSDIDKETYFSEFAVSISRSPCPEDRLDLSRPIAQGNSNIQFWFRLQGNLEYLNSDQARNPFDVRFFLLEQNVPLLVEAIELKQVNRRTARLEANSNEGRFDWRLKARKQYFKKPGEYAMSVVQDGKTICFLTEARTEVCQLRFKVE